jgi:diphthamide biosynthesis methyltransferase
MYKIPKDVTFDMARAGATSLRELTAIEKNIYIGLKAIHKTDVQQYQRYLTEIARLQSKILTTIAEEKRAMLRADKSV